MVGCTGCCIDGMCPESWSRDILSVKKAKMSVPLHLPFHMVGGDEVSQRLPADLGPLTGVEVMLHEVYQVVEAPPRNGGLMSEDTT